MFIYALVNVNSQGPPMGSPGDSERVYLTNTTESDSLILTHSGISDKTILTQGNSEPSLKELLQIFNTFHLLPVNPHPLTQGFSDRKQFVCVSFTCFSSCICMKHMCLVYYTHPGAFWPIKIYIHPRTEMHLWQGTFDP